MPLYEYQCMNCNYRFDKLVMRHDSETTCPICQGDVRKLMSTFALSSAGKAAGSLPDAAPGCKSCVGCSGC